MSITSFYFLALVTVGVLVYYVVPKSIQWMILLVLSAVFYYFAATPCTIGYLVVSTMIAYLSTMWIQKKRDALGREAKGLLVVTFVALAVNIAIWFFVKGRGLWVHDKRMNDCLPPILFSAIFKLLKVLPDTELDAC